MELSRPWLDNYDSDVPTSIDFSYRPLFEYLDRTAEKWPKRTAIEFQNWSINYIKLQQTVEIMAANLRKHGLEPGRQGRYDASQYSANDHDLLGYSQSRRSGDNDQSPLYGNGNSSSAERLRSQNDGHS